MEIFIILIINLIFANFNVCNGQKYLPKSPCPNVFIYHGVDSSGHNMLALINVYGMQINRRNTIRVTITNNEPIFSERDFEPLNDQQTLLNNARKGQPILFGLILPFLHEIPEVVEIKSNGYTICSNSRILSSNTLTIDATLQLSPTSDIFPRHQFSSFFPYDTINHLNEYTNRIEQEFFNNLINNPFGMMHIAAFPNHRHSRRPSYNNKFIQSQFPDYPNSPSYSQNEFIPPDVPAPLLSQRNFNPELDKNCGTIHAYTQLIIGGRQRERGTWPWLTALFKNNSSARKYICSGSLISSGTVITAAHCVSNDSNLDDYLMGIGVYNIKEEKENGAQYSKLKGLRVHPDYEYSEKHVYADIAIVILENPVVFSEIIHPICLWNNIENSVHKLGIVGGWGASDIEKQTDIPTYVDVLLVSNSECQRSHTIFRKIFSDGLFCGNGSIKGTGPCHGDSGGGLMIKKNNKWFLKGIVSLALSHPTKNCDLENFVIYIDVPKFMDWIEDNMTP